MNIPKRNYKINEERTNDYLKNFDKHKVLKLLVNNDKPIIFDVGANKGQSVQYYRNLFPDSIIHCFEPDVDVFKILCENCKNLKNVYLNNCGIGSEKTTLKFYKNDDINSELNSFIKLNVKNKDSITLNNDNSEEYKTKMNHYSEANIIKLSDYIKENNIEKIDLLKLDTQGYEEECLKGIENNFHKIKIILTEIMFYDLYEKSLSFYDLEKYLIPNNFRLYDISHISKNPMNGRLDWVDAIYVNQNDADLTNS
jgi:FkbM family methyltransferase